MIISRYLLICVGFYTVNWCTSVQFGRCNETVFFTQALGCEKTFYRKLVTSSSANNCSQLYKVHVYDCYNHTLMQCYRDAMSNWQLPVRIGLLTIDAFGHAQFYCSSDKITLKLSKMPEEIRNNFPCSEEYLLEGQKCSEKVRNLLAKNPKHPSLCREYSRSVSCTKRVAKKYCNTTIDIPAEISNVAQENPFCPEEKDDRKDDVSATPKKLTENENKYTMAGTLIPLTSFADTLLPICGFWILPGAFSYLFIIELIFLSLRNVFI